jgi:PST family polysaccharide transporter
MHPSGIGFVILLSLSGITGLAVAIYLCNKKNWLAPLKSDWWRFNRNEGTIEFIKIGSATLATGLMGTGSVLILRALIIKFDGYASAGIFDAAWSLSMTYVMLILTSFSAYYLPTLGIYKGKPQERNGLIEKYFRFATFTSIPLIAVVMLLRPWVVELLYSKEFLPAIHMMRWMLLGDFFKISSWVMAMPMLAYADIKPYVLSEFLWNFGLSLLAYFALAMGCDIERIGVIFMILYFFYFSYTYLYCRKKFILKIGFNLFLVWVLGVLFLSGISFISH